MADNFTLTQGGKPYQPKDSEIAAKPPVSTSFPKLPPSVSVKDDQILVANRPQDSGQAYMGEMVPKIYVQQSNEIERNGGMAGALWEVDTIGSDTPSVSIDNSSPSQTTTEETKSPNWPLLISLAGLLLSLLLFKLKK